MCLLKSNIVRYTNRSLGFVIGNTLENIDREKYEGSHMAQYSKPIASITQNQTRQRRGTSTKTAVQIWLFTAFLGTVLGTASEIFHLVPWLNTLPQQLGTIVRYPTGQTNLSPQSSLSPLAAHPIPTMTPT